MLGMLYIVATPIGNLEDITFRAARTLLGVDTILAEDTRVTRKLIDSLVSKLEDKNLRTPIVISYHQHSSDQKKMEIVKSLVDGKSIALVTDAGTPGVSDPGNELISFICERIPEVKIIPLPGPSALTTTLSVCGLNVNKFYFLGFWPKKKTTKLLDTLKNLKTPFVFYESPFRIIKTLEQIDASLGNRNIFVARELTKVFETLYRGNIKDVLTNLKTGVLKGELVVVVDQGI